MALNLEKLAEDTKQHVKNKGSYWAAALFVSDNNYQLARQICSILGKRGGKKAARLSKKKKLTNQMLKDKRVGQLHFNF